MWNTSESMAKYIEIPHTMWQDAAGYDGYGRASLQPKRLIQNLLTMILDNGVIDPRLFHLELL